MPHLRKPMKKVRWHITKNADNKEYDYTTYQCIVDDAWVNTEIPIAEKRSEKKT